MTSRELLTIAGGIILAVLVVPFGGAQAPLAIGIIAVLVLWDLARERRKREHKPPR